MATNQSAPRVLELAVTVGIRSLHAYAQPGSVVGIGPADTAEARVQTTGLVMDIVPKKRLLLLAVSLDAPENLRLADLGEIWMERNPGNILLGRDILARQDQGMCYWLPK